MIMSTEQKQITKSDVLERLRTEHNRISSELYVARQSGQDSTAAKHAYKLEGMEYAIALVEQLPDPINDEREAFEAWASVPPREWSLTRFSNEAAWPGAYADYAVHCAWDAWKDRAAVPDDEGEVAELRALLRAAKCPCTGCEDGTIAIYGPDGNLEPEQCHWCHARDAALSQQQEPNHEAQNS